MSSLDLHPTIRLLLDIVGKFNSTMDPSRLLHDIIESTKGMVEAEASSLFLLSDGGKNLELTIPTGPATAEVSGKKIASDHGISGWVVQHQQPVLITDVQSDPRFQGELLSNPKFQSRNMICVPLNNNQGKTIGVLQAINIKEDFLNEEMLGLFQTLANQAATALENVHVKQQQLAAELVNKELEVATEIQARFFPQQTPNLEGYEVAGCSIPAKDVGGDYYDFIPNPEPCQHGFVVADVTGKGVPASLLMATMRATLRANIQNNPNDIVQALRQVNGDIYRDSPVDKFITSIYCNLDYESHELSYVNSGHNPPYIVRANDNRIEELDQGGVMLGIMEEIDLPKATLSIDKGDILMLFSDGVTEATNPSGELFSEERFEQWLLDHNQLSAEEMKDALLKTLRDYADGSPQSDDITFIIVKRTN
ncbi:SpoIIE family protein phosphatase [Bacteroidota bacterium]|jgi:sigma-B regulation protein RsbU (phosphoserine phosphatase)|nr:SpoIIE family protein phosphatase [Balneolaceae bacterium]MDC3136063.1 SpoIIE family protein phosphatase [Bacteroidota bacterium]MDC3296690.1 SpoIIE family protein phosphatase [Balneolaceae bacterium]